MAFKSELQFLAPATTSPSPLPPAAANSPENRESVTMADVKFYQRRNKEIKKEKQHVDAQQNWVPETPAKPVPVRPQIVYTKKSAKCNLGPSFLSRLSNEEAEIDRDVTVTTASVGEKEEKVDKGRSLNFSCLSSTSEAVSIDLNKSICDTEDAGVSSCGSNADGGSGMFNHGGGDICTFLTQSYEGLVDNLSRPLELSSTHSVAPPGECAIDRCPDASFRDLDITSEYLTKNCFPEIHNSSYSSPLKNDLNNATECDKEKDSQVDCSLKLETTKLHPLQQLEPATPLIKHKKRPSTGGDRNPRPAKRKKHRPKVVVDGVPKRQAKILRAQTEKMERVRKSPPKGKKQKKNQSVKRLKKAVEDHADELVSRTGTVSTGDHGSNEILLIMPELPSIHSTQHNLTAMSDLKIDSYGHKEKLTFPTLCKRRRMKRKKKPRVSVILNFFLLKGHTKKKRSVKKRLKRFMPTEKIDCEDHFVGETLTAEEGKGMDEESVSNAAKQSSIREEQGEQQEIQIVNSLEAQNHERGVPQNVFEMRPLAAYPELQEESLHKESWLKLIDKSIGIQKGFNHEDIIMKKGAIVPHQGSLPPEESALVPHTGSLSPVESALVPHTGSLSPVESALVPHTGSLSPVESALVPHTGSLSPVESALIPHQGSLPPGGSVLVPHRDVLSPEKGAVVLHHSTKKKIKSRIEMDPETMRQWIQIKRIEDGLGEEEVDEETKRKWEEDRKLFQGRVDAFNCKMRAALGNRKFKPWTASVMDSAVGVFLTQNVSDILSSSAYMSLAAAFPNKNRNQEELHCSHESTGSTNAPGSQYYVTYNGERVVDIEDFGKPIRNGVETSSRKHSPNFLDFYQGCCSSSGGCHESDNSKTTGFGTVEAGTQESVDSLDFQHDKELKVDEEVVPHGASSTDPASKEAKRNVDKKKKVEKKDWDRLRRKYSQPRSSNHTDAIDWEAVRQADVNVIAKIIKARGQHTIIAGRIKAFLDRVVKLHGSLDLEWLRHAPQMLVKEYLLDVQGLGLKSVECIRLLELGHIAFPVDTNVTRIATRLNWVPLEPLPGDLQFHLLEEYPLMDAVQKYLWPRLRKFSHPELYEFHYNLITFGKIFCKKRSPNCNACPMRAECKHFASAVAARTNLNLPAPTKKDTETSIVPSMPVTDSRSISNNAEIAYPKISVTLLESGVLSKPGLDEDSGVTSQPGLETSVCEPLIEEPKSPELVQNIKDSGESENDCDVDDNKLIDNVEEEEEEIPTIRLNNEEFRKNVQYYMEIYGNNLRDGNSSRELVPLSVDVNSCPAPKLKRTKHLRTEHLVYKLPDDHEILRGIERRDPEDSVPYLLAIWSAGETPNSVEQPKKKCNSQGSELCMDATCFACQSVCEGEADIVRGTILIPCRTAMRGRFPLNATYFQVNEVFVDHETSCKPLNVPRKSIWGLRTPTVFCGTSASSISRGCLLEEIQENFWKGFTCMRGFDRQTREPKPLAPRFHCSPSKMEKKPRKVNPNKKKKTTRKEKGNDDAMQASQSEGAAAI